MRPTPQTNSQGGGLFHTADGKNLFIVFALVTSLFLLWGLPPLSPQALHAAE
jgi:hypothetical protein